MTAVAECRVCRQSLAVLPRAPSFCVMTALSSFGALVLQGTVTSLSRNCVIEGRR